MAWAAVAAGGAAGSLLRYAVQKGLNAGFPVGTLAVNIVGCFLAGSFAAISLRGWHPSLRLLLITGFCGGFTTFSAFGLEAWQLLQSGRWLTAAGYTTASVVGGFAATALAHKLFSA